MITQKKNFKKNLLRVRYFTNLTVCWRNAFCFLVKWLAFSVSMALSTTNSNVNRDLKLSSVVILNQAWEPLTSVTCRLTALYDLLLNNDRCHGVIAMLGQFIREACIVLRDYIRNEKKSNEHSVTITNKNLEFFFIMTIKIPVAW